MPARKQDLFSIPQKKNQASILEETWLLNLRQIDDTITVRAKENCAVQPAFTFHEGATNQKLVLGAMHKSAIPERLENGNILNPRNPTFVVVGQENETVTMKHAWLVLLFRDPI